MNDYLAKLKAGHNLSSEEIAAVMQLIMSGKAAADEVGEFLLALRAKGPTVEEITGAARIMRKFVVPIRTKHRVVLDTCGTGGDKRGTFNVSTAVALIVAASGVAVAKHGNRAVSSKAGSADVLEALGVNIELDEASVSECLDKIGIAFLFAQKLHPAMKNVAPVRKQLGVETIFNVLGPLTNPATATHQMMGIYSRDLVEPMARVLQNLGLRRAMVVCGADGLDEVTTTAKTFVSEFNRKEIVSYDLDPKELGIAPASFADLLGGDAQQNAAIITGILNGELGPKRDIVVVNAGCALYVAEKTRNIAEGLKLAAEMIDSGKALKKLEEFKEFTNAV